MSRWIDIDDISLLKTVSVGDLSAKALWKRIRQQPSIDIVRCKECKWKDTFKCWMRNTQVPRYPNADDFCSYGERKESE